jgi:hypothetical protein
MLPMTGSVRVCDHTLTTRSKETQVSHPIGHPSEITNQYLPDQAVRNEMPEQRLTIQHGDKVRLPDNHPMMPGEEAIVVSCGTYQVLVRLIDHSCETWAFSNDVTILRKCNL